MRPSQSSLSCLLLFSFLSLTRAKLTWASTKFLVVFGDSYTTDGFNISNGVDSPVPGFTSANGPNWVNFLGSTYNVTDVKVFDLASGGATIDAALVPPFQPTVLSIVDQVSQFNHILAPTPIGAQWQSSDTLFAFWIGINDVGNSFGWTNVTRPDFYTVLVNRLSVQLEELYQSGARSFLFLTVPPVDRSPLFLQQGRAASTRMSAFIASYNRQLTTMVGRFKLHHPDLDQVTIFDTQPVFKALLDNAGAFGFTNVTGWCQAYENGTPEATTQVEPCAPVSSYFWLNSLHPLFTIHNMVAHAISTALST